MSLRTVFFLIAFLAPGIPVLAQEPGPVVIFLSENEGEYIRNAEAFRLEMGGDVTIHTYSLSEVSLDDPKAKKLLDRALELKPRFLLAVGQKALFLVSSQQTVPVIFSGVPDYLTAEIQRRQKSGVLKNINGVAWGDQDCAVEALKALHEILPKARRVGIIYHEFSQKLIDALKGEARKLEIEIVTEKLEKLTEAVPAIRRLVKRVDAFLVPKRDKYASRGDVRKRLLEIATENNKIPVFTTHPSDIKEKALALVDLDPASRGREAAVFAKKLLGDGFGAEPVIGEAKKILYQRKFKLDVARDLRVARPKNPKWEMVQ